MSNYHECASKIKKKVYVLIALKVNAWYHQYNMEVEGILQFSDLIIVNTEEVCCDFLLCNYAFWGWWEQRVVSPDWATILVLEKKLILILRFMAILLF